MELLFFFLFLALGISFLCSVLESVILTVPSAYISVLKKKNIVIGTTLSKYKKDIDRPLAAILSLNTIAHTIGAAGVGAQAMLVFGEAYLAITSAILTILILILSEIIPKTLGVIYWRKLVVSSVYTLRVLIILLYPFVVLAQKITRIIAKKREIKTINREEIKALIEIGYKEGAILKHESFIVKNLMHFGSLKAKDIMTPRPVIFALQSKLTLQQVFEKHTPLKFSRIPIFENRIDDISFYVRKDDLLFGIAKGKRDKKIKSFKRKLVAVPEYISLIQLFDDLLKQREYIALTVDEHGGVTGIVTLEDLVETIIGIEIVDETDTTMDMQKLARKQWLKRSKKLGPISNSED